jgi:hypothetical protein
MSGGAAGKGAAPIVTRARLAAEALDPGAPGPLRLRQAGSLQVQCGKKGGGMGWSSAWAGAYWVC